MFFLLFFGRGISFYFIIVCVYLSGWLRGWEDLGFFIIDTSEK